MNIKKLFTVIIFISLVGCGTLREIKQDDDEKFNNGTIELTGGNSQSYLFQINYEKVLELESDVDKIIVFNRRLDYDDPKSDNLRTPSELLSADKLARIIIEINYNSSDSWLLLGKASEAMANYETAKAYYLKSSINNTVSPSYKEHNKWSNYTPSDSSKRYVERVEEIIRKIRKGKQIIAYNERERIEKENAAARKRNREIEEEKKRNRKREQYQVRINKIKRNWKNCVYEGNTVLRRYHHSRLSAILDNGGIGLICSTINRNSSECDLMSIGQSYIDLNGNVENKVFKDENGAKFKVRKVKIKKINDDASVILQEGSHTTEIEGDDINDEIICGKE